MGSTLDFRCRRRHHRQRAPVVLGVSQSRFGASSGLHFSSQPGNTDDSSGELAMQNLSCGEHFGQIPQIRLSGGPLRERVQESFLSRGTESAGNGLRQLDAESSTHVPRQGQRRRPCICVT